MAARASALSIALQDAPIVAVFAGTASMMGGCFGSIGQLVGAAVGLFVGVYVARRRIRDEHLRGGPGSSAGGA